MIRYAALPVLVLLAIVPLVHGNSMAQTVSGGFGSSPFERDFGDVKFLDAYFGTPESKIEVEPGDSNVPFTVVLANVGTHDITGIRGQLSLPYDFSSSDGPGKAVLADSDSNSLAGAHFHLTFFVNVDQNAKIQQYPGAVKVDYSRLRESGVRTAFADFTFKITGDSIINVKALEPFLTSLRSNEVVIEIANDGTAPLSTVDIVATNTHAENESAASSTKNVENVVILETNWGIGNIEPKSAKHFTATVYVPEYLKGDTLRIPLVITYYNAHGDRHMVDKIANFYIKGLVELSIYNVQAISLSDSQMVVGEVINEGNEDALFGFVTLEGMGESNIKTQTQFIDEIEIDAPVPFNLPLEFDGEPAYGKHEIKITVRYKDSVRDELFVPHETFIFVSEPLDENEPQLDYQFAIIPAIIGIAAAVFALRRRKKPKLEA